MGSCSSTAPTKVGAPPRPDKQLYFVRYAGNVYATETYKLYLTGLTNEQIHYYIINVMNSIKCNYVFTAEDVVVIYNIMPIIFNNMFANLSLVQTVDMPIAIQTVPIPSAPFAEDPK